MRPANRDPISIVVSHSHARHCYALHSAGMPNLVFAYNGLGQRVSKLIQTWKSCKPALAMYLSPCFALPYFTVAFAAHHVFQRVRCRTCGTAVLSMETKFTYSPSQGL